MSITVTFTEEELREVVTATLREAEVQKKEKETLESAGFDHGAKVAEYQQKHLLDAFYKMLHAESMASKERKEGRTVTADAR